MASKKITLRKEMGKRVRNLRRSAGTTIDVLAEKLGITQSHLGLIERGERGITVERLVVFCDHFKCSADYMLTGKDSGTSTKKQSNSKLANAIDLLLSDEEKQCLYDFVNAIK